VNNSTFNIRGRIAGLAGVDVREELDDAEELIRIVTAIVKSAGRPK